jgi:hypothetical protein
VGILRALLGMMMLAPFLVLCQQDGAGFYRQARSDFDGMRYDSGLTNIGKAIALDPGVSAYYIVQGNLFMKKFLKSEAERSYRKALGLDPKNRELRSYCNRTFGAPSPGNSGGRSAPDESGPCVNFEVGPSFEFNNHGECLAGLEIGASYARKYLVASLFLTRDWGFFSTVGYIEHFTHVRGGVGVRIPLAGAALVWETVAGIGFSGYVFNSGYPAYAALQMSRSEDYVVQGGTAFVHTRVRHSFNALIGVFLGADYLATGLSTAAVINGLFRSRADYIRTRAFSVTLGMTINRNLGF